MLKFNELSKKGKEERLKRIEREDKALSEKYGIKIKRCIRRIKKTAIIKKNENTYFIKVDTTGWKNNSLQNDTFYKFYSKKEYVSKRKEISFLLNELKDFPLASIKYSENAKGNKKLWFLYKLDQKKKQSQTTSLRF